MSLHGGIVALTTLRVTTDELPSRFAMNHPEPRLAALDLSSLPESAAPLTSELRVEELERLAAATLPQCHAAPVTWSARAEHRQEAGNGQLWLHLEARAEIDFECQRCLEPVRHAVHARRSFQFVAGGEAAAAELDAQVEHDVLPLTRHLDLVELLEDELLLELPIMPRHDACVQIPVDSKASAAAQDGPAPHPFAALAALQKKPPRK